MSSSSTPPPPQSLQAMAIFPVTPYQFFPGPFNQVIEHRNFRYCPSTSSLISSGLTSIAMPLMITYKPGMDQNATLFCKKLQFSFVAHALKTTWPILVPLLLQIQSDSLGIVMSDTTAMISDRPTARKGTQD